MPLAGFEPAMASDTRLKQLGHFFFLLSFFFFCTLSLHISLSRLSCILLFSGLTTHNINIHAPNRFRTRNLSKRSAADPRLRPLGPWN